MQYYLMHKDIPALELTIDDVTKNLLNYKILDSAHAPFGSNDKYTFARWWERRAIPKTQQNSAVLLGGKTNMEYMMDNLSLSLVDCYWIKPIDSAFRWQDVNLYDHSFAENDFSYADLEHISPFKPSATTQGELQKRWKIMDGKRYLIKGNYGAMYRQSLNEVFVTDLHGMQQRIPYVPYKKIELPTTMGDGIGCICPIFTSQQAEFIPAYDVTNLKKQPNDVSVYQHYINTCVAMGIPTATMQKFMDYMVLSDFLVTNTDRHLLNLGILRNPDTLEWIAPAPLFDTGNAMFYNTTYAPRTVLTIQTTSFYKTELRMLDQVKDRMLLDLSSTPDATDLAAYYADDPYAVVYLDNLKQGYARKQQLLETFCRGYSLNTRSSRFYTGVDLSDDTLDR